MQQFSITPHWQNPLAWLEHPILVLFLPYSVRTVPLAFDAVAVRLLFESNRDPWQLVDVEGLFVTVQRRYDAVAHAGHLRIHGPYGHKAWTMVTLVSVVLDEVSVLLTLRTFPHRGIVLGMLASLVFTSLWAIAIGIPAAPWFPLLFFGPFLYVTSVIATKVEAARIATLVRQAVEGASTTE